MIGRTKVVVKAKSKMLPSQTEMAAILNGDHMGHIMDLSKKLKAFKSQHMIKRMHISQKRKSLASALKDFKDLYSVDEYFLTTRVGDHYRDDSVEVFYTTTGG
ncbi:hypothetical protein [Reinekea sp. G2M2-21]|uniref:hypothetical protein n=1 Tax=Reinekea sp. G2M2-21 TaxID=2788942 RepID=UPI0018AB8AE9|nr:hypothetical protein [Reinekea sp. G2M2-21]